MVRRAGESRRSLPHVSSLGLYAWSLTTWMKVLPLRREGVSNRRVASGVLMTLSPSDQIQTFCPENA